MNWCSGDKKEEEVSPCAAEAHGQIGVVERAIQTIKHTVRQMLQSGEKEAWQAVICACQAHNEMERVDGFSPYQWAFGRQPRLNGSFHDRAHDDPFWTSSAVVGSSMQANLRLRTLAQQTFLKTQAFQQITAAVNAKTRRNQTFLPGDLIYFKRVKPPAQPAASVRMPFKLWRWYGPGRVLATETRSDGFGEERRPAHIVWIVTHGRLKRCSPEQLRHASDREKLMAEGSDAPSTSWTFHSLTQTLLKGEFERLDDHTFPEDMTERPSTPVRRARSESRSRPQDRMDEAGTRSRSRPAKRTEEVVLKQSSHERTKREKTSQKFVEPGFGGEEAHQRTNPGNKIHQELVKVSDGEGTHQKVRTKTEEKKVIQESQAPTTPNPSGEIASGSQSGQRSPGLDVDRLLDDPMFSPTPAAVQKDRPVKELFQQPLFKKQRKELYGHDTGDEFFIGVANSENEMAADRLVFAIDLELPERSSDWRRMRRSPQAFYVKKVKGAEVKLHLLGPEDKVKFAEAKRAEVQQWLAASAVKRAEGMVPKDRIMSMRWVLTWKDAEHQKAKGRIVLIGYQDPDLESIQSSAPTMSRRTRQLALQLSSIHQWKTLKADVKAAFLQGEAVEKDRSLFAKQVPELAEAMNLKEKEVVQVLKSCYGLVSAPASWFQCINKTLQQIGFSQCRSDPCLWLLKGEQMKDPKDGHRVLGYICAHVDDFLIAGDETSEVWSQALHTFYARFKWSPWEHGSYSHCGIQVREECDFSYSLDHSEFCSNIEQITFQNRSDDEKINADELTQLRGVLGALQWRSHQTGPHLSSKLGQLQSEITRATVATLKAANKLVRECFQTRHLSTRINQLGVNDPRDIVFIGWSDAALANRIDLSSTGGYAIAAANPMILEGKHAPVSFISWRSSRLQRKARSSLSAEAQALAETDQELMFVRMAWAELCGLPIDLANPSESISKISGTVVVDAKALFDILSKRDLNSAAVGLKDKYSALEILCLLESLEALRTKSRWVHSDAQLADGLTKPLPAGNLHKVLHDGKWTLTYDPSFTSARRLKKAKRASEPTSISEQDSRGMSVFVLDSHQVTCSCQVSCCSPIWCWPNSPLALVGIPFAILFS